MPLAKLGPGRDTVPRVISTLGCALHLCQRFLKISQKTLTTLSLPGTLHPVLCHLYCHPTQIQVHWLFVHHLKESRMGRVGGMSSTGSAAQIQKAWRHLAVAAANDNDSWRNGKLTTPAAVGNLKQETSRGLLAIGHCGSTQLANLRCHHFVERIDNFLNDSAGHCAPIPKMYLSNVSKCQFFRLFAKWIVRQSFC